jgi:hypothetical protein
VIRVFLAEGSQKRAAEVAADRRRATVPPDASSLHVFVARVRAALV